MNMGYTELLDDEGFNINPESEDYLDQLIDLTKKFRPFEGALSFFLIEHGFEGNIENADKKIEFIKNKCKQADVSYPRTITKWFDGNYHRIEKKTAFQLCFAFQLSIEETNEFLRKICWEKGIDYHKVEDIVYDFCIKNKISYKEAEKIIQEISEPSKIKIKDAEQIIYTSAIKSEIKGITSVVDLKEYLINNANQFRYSNATAYKAISNLWAEIASTNGIVAREFKKYSLEYGSAINGPKDVEAQWTVLLKIMGLYGDFAEDLSRSRLLTPVLKNNELIHVFVEQCFPSRNAINDILLGDSVKDETIRKMLILLQFYYSLAKIELRVGLAHEFTNSECEKSLQEINGRLTECGYAELYVGNPYDWIFIFCLRNNHPLECFREDVMRTIYEHSKNIELHVE